MNKKLLFVLNGMSIGGPQKSLLNLIELLDFKNVDITVLLFRKDGDLLKDLPEGVRVKFIRPLGLLNPFRFNKLSYLLYLPIRIIFKIISDILIKYFGYHGNLKYKMKEFFFFRQKEQYDVAIAYSESFPIYYTIKYVNAKIKVGRVPTDYKTANLDVNFDRPYFEKLDYIYVVSDSNQKILASVFPYLAEKIIVFESIISPLITKRKANKGIGFKKNSDELIIFTMARIHHTKGIILAIEASDILARKGYEFKWYFMGSGEREEYIKLIETKGLTDQFYILNSDTNPLPYLRTSDIYVQPSLYEGKSNAVNEAKALCKPIILTNFPTSVDHLDHGVNGLIAELNSESLAENIGILINDVNYRKELSQNLSTYFKGNEHEVNKIYELLNECDNYD